LPISHSDHTTKWWGDNTDYSPRAHYAHVVHDSHGKMKEVYRYYLDDHRRPVLDGPRYIYRYEHDAGLIVNYRDGREVSRAEGIVN